mgnify:FL=1
MDSKGDRTLQGLRLRQRWELGQSIWNWGEQDLDSSHHALMEALQVTTVCLYFADSSEETRRATTNHVAKYIFRGFFKQVRCDTFASPSNRALTLVAHGRDDAHLAFDGKMDTAWTSDEKETKHSISLMYVGPARLLAVIAGGLTLCNVVLWWYYL